MKFFCERHNQKVERGDCKQFCDEYEDCVASGYLNEVDKAVGKGKGANRNPPTKKADASSPYSKTLHSGARQARNKNVRTSLPENLTDTTAHREKAALGKFIERVTLKLNKNQKNDLLDLVKRALATKDLTDQLLSISQTETILYKLGKHANELLGLMDGGLDQRLRWMLSKENDANSPALLSQAAKESKQRMILSLGFQVRALKQQRKSLNMEMRDIGFRLKKLKSAEANELELSDEDITLASLRHRLQFQNLRHQLSLLEQAATRAREDIKNWRKQYAKAHGIRKTGSGQRNNLHRDALILELMDFYRKVTGKQASFTTDPETSKRGGGFVVSLLVPVLSLLSDEPVEPNNAGEALRRVMKNPPSINPIE